MAGGDTVPVLRAEVSAVRPVGGYDAVSLSVPPSPLWERARPGQLLVVPGDPGRGAVLPRVHWLAGVSTDPLHGTTLEVVVPVATSAGAGLRPGLEVRLLGPLGRGFPLPSAPVPVLLVAHEGSAAPLRWAVALLRERGCPVHVVLSSSDPDLHLDPGSLRRQADSVVLTTPQDLRETLTARLEDGDADIALVLATGPRDLVQDVAALAAAHGRVARVSAVDPEAEVVCGTGLCGACDVHVPTPQGSRRVRPCLDGPVVPGEWLPAGPTEVARAPR